MSCKVLIPPLCHNCKKEICFHKILTPPPFLINVTHFTVFFIAGFPYPLPLMEIVTWKVVTKSIEDWSIPLTLMVTFLKFSLTNKNQWDLCKLNKFIILHLFLKDISINNVVKCLSKLFLQFHKFIYKNLLISSYEMTCSQLCQLSWFWH